MATLEQLEAKQKQIQMQIQKKRRALAAEERKARNHAPLMVAGGLLMQYAPGGDWKRVDWKQACPVDQPIRLQRLLSARQKNSHKGGCLPFESMGKALTE